MRMNACGALLLACALSTPLRIAAAAERPACVNWSYDGAFAADNGLRATIVLNGWWRWKAADPAEAAPPADGWSWRKVPAYGAAFDVLDAAGTKVAVPAAQATGSCWVEREFTVPREWAGRPVEIVFNNIGGEGRTFLDGAPVGRTWEWRPYALPLSKPYKTTPYRLSVRSDGVAGTVWLKACASPDARVTDSYLTTSFRNRSATIRAAGTGRADGRIQVVIVEYRNPEKVVRKVGPFPVAAAPGGWRIEKEFEWADARPWSPEQPNLYRYYVELLDPRGRAVDRIFPVRFGFREFWMEGGYLRLNGVPTVLVNDCHTGLGGIGAVSGQYGTDEETWRTMIRRWKGIGVNCADHRWGLNGDDDMIFRLADEEGFFLTVAFGSMGAGNREVMAIPEIRRYTEDYNRYLILPRRHSPSLVLYFLGSLGNAWDYAPSKLGEDYDVEALFGRSIKVDRDLLERLDPARVPVSFSYSGGGKTEPAHSSMNYIHIDADLQVHETWPSRWYLSRKKPLFTYEMAAPPYIADWYQRQSRGEQAHGTKGALPYMLEVSAIYHGEEPYLTEPRKNVETWLANVEKKTWSFSAFDSPSYRKVADLFTRNVFRAWRTYGVNMGLFTQVRSYFQPPILVSAAAKEDPRRPDMAPDKPYPIGVATNGPLTQVGAVAKETLAPLLVYIGGPDGRFPLKDRAWFAGETVRKAVVVVNAYETPVTVSGAWELRRPDGSAALSGTVGPATIAPGKREPAVTHIEFAAPAAAARTAYTLVLEAKADRPGTLRDSFEIAVFPRPTPAAPPRGIAVHLFDPVGDTRRLLERAGVPYATLGDTLPDPETSLLVVGRNALKDPARARQLTSLSYRKMGYDLPTSISNGLRVLVFEQALDNIWGLRTEQVRWRRTFPSAGGHPALAGLEPADFLHLRGESSLVEAYPDIPAYADRIATDRFYEWGNDNVATTYAFIRPQLGAARALVVCGFDLQETPLLEFAAGRGRMLFCQMDVTNRYGADPVSTRLADNILAYMLSAPPPDPRAGSPTDVVREGTDLAPVEPKKETVFLLDRPDGPVSWGITAADVYLQGRLDLPVFPGPDGRRYAYLRPANEKTIYHTLNQRLAKTKWQRMKMLQVRAALQINQGGSSETYPTPSLQGDAETLYPVEWVEGFVHPYLMMQW